MVFSVSDTVAALNTGDLDYFCRLIHPYPEVLKNATVAKSDGYAPIVLLGVVCQDESATKTTTRLPLLIELYTPYKTVDGKTGSITIACGTGVSVNLLLGLPFMKALKASLCFESNTMRCSTLDLPLEDSQCTFARLPSTSPTSAWQQLLTCFKLFEPTSPAFNQH